jgi:hypothetical protein
MATGDVPVISLYGRISSRYYVLINLFWVRVHFLVPCCNVAKIQHFLEARRIFTKLGWILARLSVIWTLYLMLMKVALKVGQRI